MNSKLTIKDLIGRHFTHIKSTYIIYNIEGVSESDPGRIKVSWLEDDEYTFLSYRHEEVLSMIEKGFWVLCPLEPKNIEPYGSSDRLINASKEYIICSAIWYKELDQILKDGNKDIPFDLFLPKNLKSGIVFTGFRHVHCLYLKCFMTGLRDANSGKVQQGFLTNRNNFVSRAEAALLAWNAGQIEEPKHKLYSEDIY